MVFLSPAFRASVPLAFASVLLGSSSVVAQTYRRLGTCPTLGCIFPPDQADFLPGAYFDIRLEVHAPVNGTEAYNNGVPDEEFSFCVQKGKDGECKDVTKFFDVQDAELEKWDFSYFEDLFAVDAGTQSLVNVASKAYRSVSLSEPGDYYAKLSYYNHSETVAHWTVREAARKRKAKNVLLFIGDGMTQPMVTAARMIGHKSINGKYQSLMQMDQMEALGLQMTHSIDTYITDSANSASALYTGHKSSVDAVSVYGDSSPDLFDDPKVETIGELFRRRTGGPVGIVSTASVGDATPACLCAHTRARGQYAPIMYEHLYGKSGMNELEWGSSCEGPDVIFGGGAELFIPGPSSWNESDFYQAFADEGYNVVHNKTDMLETPDDKKTLGIFSISHLAKWLDREVYPENLETQGSSPSGDGTDALDQPGLKDMTLKAIDILQARSKGKGWFMMSEAASIDKMMHLLDYDRALGELLELDDTIRASMAHLKEIGELEDTLIVVTADHGHGFDVFGSADTKYMRAQTDDLGRRKAVGTYQGSGASGYQVAAGSLPNNDTIVTGPQGPNFPVQWDPRYVFAAGMGANPDRREGYQVNKKGPRLPATQNEDGIYVANPEDQRDGFYVTGTLPAGNWGDQGVHSLTDVPVYASGPGSELFRGVYNSIDIFYKMADALALGNTSTDDDDC